MYCFSISFCFNGEFGDGWCLYRLLNSPPLKYFWRSQGGRGQILLFSYINFFHKYKISVGGLYRISSTIKIKYSIELELLFYFPYICQLFDTVAYLPTFRLSGFFRSRFLIFCLTFIYNYQPAYRSRCLQNQKIFALSMPWYNLFLILFRWKVIVQYRVNCFY